MAKFSVTLQAVDGLGSSGIAYELHRQTIKLPQIPRPGDFIKDLGTGYVEVVRIVYDIEGDVTVVIK